MSEKIKKMSKKLIGNIPKLSKCQLEVLDKLLDGWEIQVDYTNIEKHQVTLISDEADAAIGWATFHRLKDTGLIKKKYCPAMDIERWS